MVSVTRVTGLGVTAGTLYGHNAKAMLVTVKNAGDALNRRRQRSMCRGCPVTS